MTAPVLFEERQRPAPWVRALLLSIPAVPLYGFATHGLRGRPCDRQPMSNAGLALFLAGTAALAAVLWKVNLLTQVRPGEVYVRLWPFPCRRISVSEVEVFQVRTYHPIREYGGWGIRFGFRGGMAYNMRGNRGVELQLAGGRRLLIGSQRPEELAAALRAARAAT